MKPIFSARAVILALAALLPAYTAFAQPNGNIEVPFRQLPDSRTSGCNPAEDFYDAERLKTLAAKPNCTLPAVLRSGSDDNHAAYYRVGGDCHMRVALKLFRIDAEAKFKLIINVLYGGCRAGGWRSGWIIFEKMPPGFSFETVEVPVETPLGADADTGFVFPRPPSTIVRESLPTREIDLNGCLELSGQSQWVLATREHLERALSDSPRRSECLDRVKEMGIDLEKETLVGYGFASGHCGRPPNLEFQTVKETSSYPKENRYVVTAVFDDPGEKYCRIWTTWQAWLAIPKLAEGYGLALETRRRKLP